VSKKQKVAEFKIGDVVCVSAPTIGINLKVGEETNEDGTHKSNVEEVILVGDEALIVSEIEYIKYSNEYLYKVLTENSLETKEFSFAEEQLVSY
jgi:hypothetical protein